MTGDLELEDVPTGGRACVPAKGPGRWNPGVLR